MIVGGIGVVCYYLEVVKFVGCGGYLVVGVISGLCDWCVGIRVGVGDGNWIVNVIVGGCDCVVYVGVWFFDCGLVVIVVIVIGSDVVEFGWIKCLCFECEVIGCCVVVVVCDD